MDRHPLVPVVRAWLAAAGLLVLCFAWPEMALAVPLILMPNPCCCGAEPCSCCDSGTTPSRYQFEVAGIANFVCTSCATYNQTYILDQHPVDPCRWFYAEDFATCSFPSTLVVSYQVCELTGIHRIRIGVIGNVGIWEYSESSPFDCSLDVDNGDIVYSSWSGFLPDCDGAASTIDITVP